MEFCIEKSKRSECQQSSINNKFQSNCENLPHGGFPYIAVSSTELPDNCKDCVTNKPNSPSNLWCVEGEF